jgi:hypothetical protein
MTAPNEVENDPGSRWRAGATAVDDPATRVGADGVRVNTRPRGPHPFNLTVISLHSSDRASAAIASPAAVPDIHTMMVMRE